MHVVVATCAHRGDDARIVHRQAAALLAAGHRVTLVAPAPPPDSMARDPDGLARVVVPRAVGRRRLGAWRAVYRAVRALRRRGDVDLLLFHDPELVLVLARRSMAPFVWDVHEDYVAQVERTSWLPDGLRAAARTVVGRIERRARRTGHLILAEHGYARRLGDHPVVPNSTWVPDPSGDAPHDDPPHDDPPRVVYIGRVSVDRGVHELIDLGRRLAGRTVVEVIGAVDAEVRDAVDRAAADGVITVRGYLPNPVALDRLRGALCGVSLLHATPNYVVSRPTKVMEYLAHGVPVITSSLPLAAELVGASGAGTVVDPGPAGLDAVQAQIEAWAADPAAAVAAGRRGQAYVREHHAWQRDAERFVALLEAWARPATR